MHSEHRDIIKSVTFLGSAREYQHFYLQLQISLKPEKHRVQK